MSLKLACCGGSCLLLIFSIVAIACSVKSLAQGKYALHLNWTTQKIGDVITSPGVKTVGLGNMLIEFPATFQTMYFVLNSRGVGSGGDIVRGPIIARSNDGLEMTVSASLQWKLEPQALKPLYNILGEDYREELVRFARASIIEACANFTADAFFTNRTQISVQMLGILNTYFVRPAAGLSVTIAGLQLREVDLPDLFDREISATQAAVQDVDVAAAERDRDRTVAERELFTARQAAEQLRQQAQGIASKVGLETAAAAQQSRTFQYQQALANAAVLQLFENSSDPFKMLFDLMEVRALSDHNATKLRVNM